MLELGESLRTWALLTEPAAGQTISARALADHRPAYLDYEGPVSGGRGTVSQCDAGTFDTVEVKDDLVAVRLAGRKLLGRVMIELTADSAAEPIDKWQFRFIAD